MKKFLFLLILWCLPFHIQVVLGQSTAEVFFNNYYINDIVVKVYPVSMVFNNDHNRTTHQSFRNYNLIARDRGYEPPRDFINGRNALTNGNLNHYWTIYVNDIPGVKFENDYIGGSAQGTKATLGLGVYRFDFFWTGQNPDISEPFYWITVEYDWGHATYTGMKQDLYFEFRNGQLGFELWYAWDDNRNELGQPVFQLIPPIDRKLISWDHMYNNNHRSKDYGDFKYNYGTQDAPNPYEFIPLDPRIYCNSTYFPSAVSDQNHVFEGNDFGQLTQKLTIQKNITTPIAAPYYEFDPPKIVIKDGPPDASNHSGATLHLSAGEANSNQERTFQFLQYPGETFGTDMEIERNGTFELAGTTNGLEKAHVSFANYCDLVLDYLGHLDLGQNSLIEMTGNSTMYWKANSYVSFATGSLIQLKGTSKITDCGANLQKLRIQEMGGHYYRAYNCPEWERPNPFVTTLENGSMISMSDNSVFRLGENCRFIFDGPDSYMQIESGCNVIIGENSSIEFTNGAYLDASGCTFAGDGNAIWEGLKFENAGASTVINNCTFTGAKNPVYITNDAAHSNLKKIVQNNTFYLPVTSTNNVAIGAYNLYNCLIEHNTIYAGSTANNKGILVQNSETSGAASGPGGGSYQFNIYRNVIYDGGTQISLNCLAASPTPFYTAYNVFTGSTVTNYGLWANNISGSFKNNTFLSSGYNAAVDIINSNIDFFANTITTSSGYDIYSGSGAVARLEPAQDEYGNYVFYGGYNKLTTGNFDNVSFERSGIANTNSGRNCFYVGDISNYHINGNVEGAQMLSYECINNFWNTEIPLVRVMQNGNPVQVNYYPTLNFCTDGYVPSPIGYELNDMGDGIIDTVYITSGNPGGGSGSSEASENVLIYRAKKNNKHRSYEASVLASKELVNNYASGKYLTQALDELFMAYQLRDTTGEQVNTNSLFTELKGYIEQKMQQYQSNVLFTERAYKYYLMCLTKIKQYSEAISGYENIMNNHPDPMVRLTASWDRAAVILLMNGGAGGESGIKKPKKQFSFNPIHGIAEKSFTKQKKLNERSLDENIEKSIQRKKIEQRITKFNPVNLKELTKRISEDMQIVGSERQTKTIKRPSNVPSMYKLYQNYPNPFNPATSIKFDLPYDGNIKFVVYDVLGKEIYVLNENMKAGTHEIKFDGSTFASGMYFYKLESKSFVETKKMVLIK